jgi:hypothetical protein
VTQSWPWSETSSGPGSSTLRTPVLVP